MPERNGIVFSCRTLTPIWTGDVDGNSGSVKESGILGSLRFWYEGLLRGHGIKVCGSLGQNEKCDCDVCDLFGKTRQARKFRIAVEGLNPKELFFQSCSASTAEIHGAYLYSVFRSKDNQKMRDYQPGTSFELKCLWATKKPFTIDFEFRAAVKSNRYKGLLALLLHEVSTKGGIGAKTQMGFGQIEIVSPPDHDLQTLIGEARQELKAMAERRPADKDSPSGEYFTLHQGRFFSLLFEGALPREYLPANGNDIGIRPSSGTPFVPCAFDIRYSRKGYKDPDTNAGLRPRLKADFPASARQMLGFVETGKHKGKQDSQASGSRIHVSHLYKPDSSKENYRLKIWGDVSDPKPVQQAIVKFVVTVLRLKQLIPIP